MANSPVSVLQTVRNAIVKIGLLLNAYADLLRKAHYNHAGSYGMPHGLAFGQVQGVGKRGNDFGKPDRAG